MEDPPSCTNARLEEVHRTGGERISDPEKHVRIREQPFLERGSNELEALQGDVLHVSSEVWRDLRDDLYRGRLESEANHESSV